MTMDFVGGRKLIPNTDNSLQKLVEEYLIANKDSNFVNIDAMANSLQSKSYRFSRMKRQAFLHLVTRAYTDFCAANNLRADMEDQNAEVIEDQLNYDSDVEIEEPPPRPTMNNQLKGLYQQKTDVRSRIVNLISKPREFEISALREQQNTQMNSRTTGNFEIDVGQGFHITPLHHQAVSRDGASVRQLERTPKRKNMPISLVGSDQSSCGSESLLKLDDEDDLQIIEEFPKGTAAVRPSKELSTLPKATPVSVVQHGTQVLDSPRQSIDGSGSPDRKDTKPKSPLRTPQTSNNTPLIPNNSIESGRSQDLHPDKRGTKRKVEQEESSNSSRKSAAKLPSSQTKAGKREISVQNSMYSFDDFGGGEKLLEDICKLLMHLKHPEMYRTLGVTPPRGFLLHGPPGCGKTLLAQAIAGEMKLPMLKMAATELISGISGESESNIRDVFDQALSIAPCIIFLDEIDSITPKRETASKEMERRIVAQLLACIDDLVTKVKGDQVLLIGATSRIETIDVALRRAGRFDREICLGIPNESAREGILKVISKGLKLDSGFDLKHLAKLTPGYVGADLQALVREAAVQAVTEILGSKSVRHGEPEITKEDQKMDVDFVEVDATEPTVDGTTSACDSAPPHEPVAAKKFGWIKDTAPLSDAELSLFCISMKDFENALKNVQPSAKREGFATVPDITWDNIGALTDVRDELQVSILGPVKHSLAFQALGLNAPAGVLLCGPPGCGKTLLAKAVANEAGINFISVKGPELLNMYVGESERAVRQCFQRAKNSSPCVIFFDELDSLCPRRSEGIESGSSSRVVNQLLTEMDGMESRLGVFVMGATNRPDIIDPAILRPGRLDKVLFVNLPSPSERVEILKAITKNGTMPRFAEDVSIDEVGMDAKCENYTGADLASLVREAGIAAFREFVLGATDDQSKCSEMDLKIYRRHFEEAFGKTKPSVSPKDRQKYEKMKELHSIA